MIHLTAAAIAYAIMAAIISALSLIPWMLRGMPCVGKSGNQYTRREIAWAMVWTGLRWPYEIYFHVRYC